MVVVHGAPALNPTTLPVCTTKRVPLARILRTAKSHEIESGDSAGTGKVSGLLPKASLERGGLVSQHHALRDTNVTGGKLRPLGRMVNPGSRAFVPISMKSEPAWAGPCVRKVPSPQKADHNTV